MLGSRIPVTCSVLSDKQVLFLITGEAHQGIGMVHKVVFKMQCVDNPAGLDKIKSPRKKCIRNKGGTRSHEAGQPCIFCISQTLFERAVSQYR